MTEKLRFSSREIARLQVLAKKVANIASKDTQDIKRTKWYNLNNLEATEPVIFADPENGWHEIIPDNDLECVNPTARQWEFHLLKEIYWEEHIKDDKVIDAYFDVGYIYEDTGWGLDINIEGGDDNGAFHIIPPLIDYETDFEKLRFPDLLIDYEKTVARYQLAKDIFDGILDVRLKERWWWTLGMTWDYINLRGLDQLMMDFILHPEWVHKMMNFLSEGYLKRLDFLESEGLLSPNCDNTYVGSGGFGLSTELLKKNESDAPTKTSQMWGFCESQETVGVSPQMFNEFILPYQLKLMEKFHFNCYGCCEPIDLRWDYLKTIPNLRRVSCSPWSNRKVVAKLLGKDFILSSKPSPMPLSRPNMDEDEVRRELREIVTTTIGLNVEIIMKDTHTLGNEPKNINRWVEIAREEINKRYH